MKKHLLDRIGKLPLLGLSFLILQCNVPQENNSEAKNTDALAVIENQNATPLPIELEKLTEGKRNLMIELQDADTSGYLIRSRPIIFQIQGVENNQDQHRNTHQFFKDVEVMIYSLGEAKDSVLVDYGWIENYENGEVVWEMKYENSEHAGGDQKNRKVVDSLLLPAGRYILRYVSNETHANGDWQGAPPERPFYYGITVFNLWAIEKLNKHSKGEK